ncbi:unnamed protein product [Adineta ricciae]|uniref:Trans-1,2-dihydrobenzene-1,2-diol dehydrogenase n=1 Tax=Adineta ricciae TaxID=249248 RepID=A0A813N6T7_ADIRI|nr:unnamed protein product [Adineta ricciae]CAF0848359.1 unnamed protein product [Adineta ricciae]
MALINRLWTHFSGDTKQLQKQTDALKIGILGAANICNMALLNPASKLSNVLIYGIAARDRQKAEAFARKHYIPKVYDNYDQLLADPDITAIYNPLPNGLHYEWTMKALRSGKHVLCEKPMTNNAEEAREMVDEAKKQNRLLIEAFHYRYHPFCRETVKNTISNRDENGPIRSITGVFTVPEKFLQNNDIRFQYPLGGGAQMDLGCYLVSMCRYIVNTHNNRTEQNEGEFEVQKAEALRVSPTNPQIDRGMRSEFQLDGIQCNIYNEFTNNWSFMKQQLIIECEKVTITIAYLIAPVFYHYLTIRQRDNGQTRTIKNYGDNQSTYYYQLKAFAEAIRCFQNDASLDRAYEIVYTTGTSAIRNMEIIDEIYRKAGLLVRGTKN